MPYTHQQMMMHYNRLDPAQKQAIDAAGGPNLTWFANAVGAGVPSAVLAAGGTAGAAEPGWEAEGGATLDWRSAAEPSEWLGKRMPNAQEARKWANQQHAAYIGGDRSAQDEDYERHTDRQVMAWFNEGWDVAAGGWKSGFGPHGAVGAAPGAGVGAQVGRGIANGLLHSPATALSPGRTRLADLQRVLEDQLLGRQGIFGLADARTGSSGVRTSDIYGQSLSGGGLWWGADKGMFDPNKQPQQQRRQAAAPVLPAAAPPPTAIPAPAAAPITTAPQGIRDAVYRKFPTRGPFNRWMTQ